MRDFGRGISSLVEIESISCTLKPEQPLKLAWHASQCIIDCYQMSDERKGKTQMREVIIALGKLNRALDNHSADFPACPAERDSFTF